MKKIGMAVAASLAGGAVLFGAVLAGGAVFASSPSRPTASTGTATRAGDGRPYLLDGAYHGEGSWVLVNGTTWNTTSDFGQITAVGPDSVTITRRDGQSVTVPVGPSTCIRNDGQPASLSELSAGERALVTQSNGRALALRAGTPPREKDRRGCGLLLPVVHGEVTVRYLDGSTRTFAYDPGTIAAIGDGQISVVRRDGQTVTLTYDHSTFVLEEGARGSVDDLKAGEGAMFFSERGKAVLIRCIQELPPA